MTNRSRPRILLIGTGDTTSDELLFMQRCIADAGGETVLMDVSVLGDPPYKAAHDKHAVAAAADTTIAAVIASGDENSSMTLMARSAARLTRQHCDQGRIDAMIAIGGTMGTDLALDVALALPLGFPKLIVSTIAFSHLIPPERIAADLMVILWAGGPLRPQRHLHGGAVAGLRRDRRRGPRRHQAAARGPDLSADLAR